MSSLTSLIGVIFVFVTWFTQATVNATPTFFQYQPYDFNRHLQHFRNRNYQFWHELYRSNFDQRPFLRFTRPNFAMFDPFVPPRDTQPARPFNDVSNDIFGYRSPVHDPILKATPTPTRPYMTYPTTTQDRTTTFGFTPVDRVGQENHVPGNLPVTNEKPFKASPIPGESLFTPTSGILKVITPSTTPKPVSTEAKTESMIDVQTSASPVNLSTEPIKPTKAPLRNEGVWTTARQEEAPITTVAVTTVSPVNDTTDAVTTESPIEETTLDTSYLFRELPDDDTKNEGLEDEKPEDLDEDLYRVEMSPTDKNELGSVVTEMYDEGTIDDELDKLNNDDSPTTENQLMETTEDSLTTTTLTPEEDTDDDEEKENEMLEFILNELWNAALDLQKLLNRLTDPLALTLNVEFAALDSLVQDTKNKVTITPNDTDKINKQVLKIVSNLTVQRVRSNRLTIKKQRLENLAKLLKLSVENNGGN